MHITKQTYRQRGDGPALCVLLPTRELAQQVQAVRFFILNINIVFWFFFPSRSFCERVIITIQISLFSRSRKTTATRSTWNTLVCLEERPEVGSRWSWKEGLTWCLPLQVSNAYAFHSILQFATFSNCAVNFRKRDSASFWGKKTSSFRFSKRNIISFSAVKPHDSKTLQAWLEF